MKVGEVYSVDASRRTTAANAYVTGLGPTKRVVLFDTLLDRYTRDEVRVVVAHELAHVRHRDVPRGILLCGDRRARRRLRRAAPQLGARPERGNAAPRPAALALAAALVSAPLGLIGNGLSRAIERRADAYSLTLADAPDAFISFERAIALQNVGRPRSAALADPPAGDAPADGRADRRRRGSLAQTAEPPPRSSARRPAPPLGCVYSVLVVAAAELGQVPDALLGLPA